MPDPILFLKRQIGAIQSFHFETTVLVSILYSLKRRIFMCSAVYEMFRVEQSLNQGQEGEQTQSLQSGQKHQNWTSEKKSSGLQILYLATGLMYIYVVE